MIVLDASVVIAHLSAAEPRHAVATALLLGAESEQFAMSSINIAEVLVGYVRDGRVDTGVADLAAIGIEELPMPADAAVRLAELRARTGLKLPDCCALLAAESAGATIASFDRRLCEAATERGLSAVPQP